MEWVEVKGKTVETAVQAAIQELGLATEDEVSVEVLQEPLKGILGIGGQPAVVRVTRKPTATPARSGRSRRGGSRGRGERQANSRREPGRDSQTGGREGGSRERGRGSGRDRGERRPAPRQDASNREHGRSGGRSQVETTPEEREAQSQEIDTFLKGLLAEFGLEGEVRTRVEDDTVLAEINGEQTEALVGAKGSVMQAVHELLRAVVQRKSTGRARVRLDVGGYQERRREALRIYAERLAKRVLEEGGEAMLEPMNPADRKVVHDAILEIPGVRSYSEGEEPDRAVVIAAGVPAAAVKDQTPPDEEDEDLGSDDE